MLAFGVAVQFAIGLAAPARVSAADRLPSIQVDAQGTAVAGLSSGAYMAAQYELAYSAAVRGVAVVAGGPWNCTLGNMLNAGACMGQVAGKTPVPALMADSARSAAAAGKIDSLDNLKGHRVYLFSGTNDQIVKTPVMDAAAAFYRLLGVEGDALDYVHTVPAGHAWITPEYGADCGANAAPFINHCSVGGVGYDQAGEFLRHVYGNLNPPAAELSASVQTFDQKELAGAAAKMADEGYVFVPAACRSGARCRLVIVFHGCAQSAKTVGDKVYAHAGFNRWADTNQLVVLYPQVNASLFNLQGCWDWFGYTGGAYASKAAPQLVAVKAMADRLMGAAP
jgi:poly(3-hydroxybutyrate) depolymerase